MSDHDPNQDATADDTMRSYETDQDSGDSADSGNSPAPNDPQPGTNPDPAISPAPEVHSNAGNDQEASQASAEREYREV